MKGYGARFWLRFSLIFVMLFVAWVAWNFTAPMASGLAVIVYPALMTLVMAGLLARLTTEKFIHPLGEIERALRQIADGQIGDYLAAEPGIGAGPEPLAAVHHDLRRLALSIHATVATLDRLGRGQLSASSANAPADDLLAHTCDRLAASLETWVRTGLAIASGEMIAAPIEARADNQFVELLHAWLSIRDRLSGMNQRCQQLGVLSETLRHNIAMIAACLAEMTAQVAGIASKNHQISTSARTMAVASREMASNTHEIALNTPELEQVAGNAVERVTSANEVIDALKAHSAEIGDIIQLITDISQQTNLLALNATIEAARAGEAGRGFAVVAHEIKNLSRETAESSEDIIRKLEAIQSSSEKVREVIDDVSIAVIEIHHATGLIGFSLEEQQSIANDIAASLVETTEGNADITDAIARLQTLVQQTGEAGEHIRVSVTQLSELNASFHATPGTGSKAQEAGSK
jgi:methyl-accepting chemotaxis protein